jgi:DNA polymerase III sliding clamp (beta) subunit (PCNA family)
MLQIAAGDTVRSTYSLDYLRKMARASNLAESVVVQFAKDYPLRLDFKSLNKAQMTFILAPRIENK